MEIEKYYVVEDKLGQGGQGAVYKARFRLGEGRSFAAKFCPVSVAYEAKMQGKVGGSEGVVGLFDVIEETGNSEVWGSLVLELCACSLRQYMIAQKGHPLEEREAARVIHRLATTLSFIHNKGVVHRDMKLDNIMMTSASPPYDVKIGDFGLATDNEADMKELCGTDRYMAPEVVKQESRYSEQVDVWGLGLIMYELVTNRIPFAEVKNNDDMPSFLRTLKDVEPELDWRGVSRGAKHLMLGMLEVDPCKRLTVSDVLEHSWTNTTLGKRTSTTWIPVEPVDGACAKAIRRTDTGRGPMFQLM